MAILKEHLEKISEELNSSFKETEKNISFIFYLNENVEVTLHEFKKNIYFYSPISLFPEKNIEYILTYLMRANLLGDGTGNCYIGLSENEKYLTLQSSMFYEDSYDVFKENMEQFINYTFYFEDEINKIKLQENIY